MSVPGIEGAPLLVLLAGAVATYAQARGTRGRSAAGTGITAFAFHFLAFGIAANFAATGVEGRFLLLGQVPFEAGAFAWFLTLVASGLGMAVSLYSVRYLPEAPAIERYYPLLLLMSAGIVGIALAVDLFTIFVFFELMAVASYGLVAYDVREWEPLEAGMKYVVMSATGSLVALLGVSLVWLAAGTLDLAALRTAAGGVPVLLAAPAIGLLVTGYGVKSAIAPLHTWLPDAHTAAPTGVSAMLSGVVIEAGLLALVKSVGTFVTPGGIAAIHTGLLISLLAVLTMTLGNLVALRQTDVKRMLAFSSVAQVGYIALGFGLAFEYGVREGVEGSLFHILNHAVMKGGAFLAAGAFIWIAGTRTFEGLAGVGRAAPAVGASFAILVLGLAGVPPMSGFLSKLLIAKAGLDAGGLVPLLFVIALAANSVLSLGYYVPALNRILFAEGSLPSKRVPWAMQAPVVALAAATVLIGLFPEPTIGLASAAAGNLLRLLGGG